MHNSIVSDPVLWFEGMPLLPQHFQQEFIHTQSMLHLQLQLLGDFNYGIIELEIDKMALLKNFFKINKVFAVMPDGLSFKIESSLHYNLEYELPKPDDSEKNNLFIYLSIPKLIDNNYLEGKYPRYKKANYENVLDFHSGQDPYEITKMLPNVQIQSDLDYNSNFVTIKIAHLKIDKNLWNLEEYLPASIKVTTDNPIYSLCSDLCFTIRKKINHLAELLASQSTHSQANFISENLFYAQGLGSGLPALEGLLLSGQPHPFQLYISLCNILGGLGLLTNKLSPPSPNPYQHDELLSTFQKLKSQIDENMNSVIDENISQVYFKKEENKFMGDIFQHYLTNNVLLLGFKKHHACSETEFLSWIKSAIICDVKKIEITIQNRTLGYSRERIERTEDIVPTKGVYLIKVVLDTLKEESEKLAVFSYENIDSILDEVFVFLKNKPGN